MTTSSLRQRRTAGRLAFLDRRQGVGLVAAAHGTDDCNEPGHGSHPRSRNALVLATLTLGFDSDSTWGLTYGVPDSSPAPPIRRRGTIFGRGVDAVSGQVSGIEFQRAGRFLGLSTGTRHCESTARWSPTLAERKRVGPWCRTRVAADSASRAIAE